MALIKNATDLKKYVRIAGTITSESLLISCNDAQDKYLRDVLGDKLLTDIDEWYNHATPETNAAYSALLPYVQRPLARFIMVVASAEIDVVYSEQGIGVVSTQTIAPASADRVKKLNESNLQRAYDNIETLIRFLEENKDDYPEWVASSAYTLAIRNLINSAEAFDRIINIDKSRKYFNSIRNIMDDVDMLKIKSAISADMFDAIMAEIIGGAISAENNKILPYLQRAEAYFTAAETLQRQKYDGIGVAINQFFLPLDLDMYNNKAEIFLKNALRIMDTTPDDYPEYRDSDCYIGLDDEGNTQYGGFDNTATDNHIFVM